MADYAPAVTEAPLWVRPSSWFIAFGAGLGGAFGALNAQVQAGAVDVLTVRWLPVFAAGGRWFGLAVAVVFGVPLLLYLGHAGLGLLAHWRAFRQPVTGDNAGGGDEADELRSPLVDGALDTPTDVDRYLQEGLVRLFQHGRRAGGLTWDKIGDAFANTRAWVWWTDLAAASRLVDKANGQPTALIPNKTYSWAIRQVQGGNFETPDPLPPTLPPVPAPLDADRPAKAKLETA